MNEFFATGSLSLLLLAAAPDAACIGRRSTLRLPGSEWPCRQPHCSLAPDTKMIRIPPGTFLLSCGTARQDVRISARKAHKSPCPRLRPGWSPLTHHISPAGPRNVDSTAERARSSILLTDSRDHRGFLPKVRSTSPRPCQLYVCTCRTPLSGSTGQQPVRR